MFEVRDEGGRATLYIYGTIGDDWWSPEDSNRARDLSQALDGLSPAPLDIRIDSCGGDVYEGFAIAAAIQRYDGPTTAHIDGIAASAASYIALSADRVHMSDFAWLMIHNAWAMCTGNCDGLREMADRLEGIDGSIAKIISARSGMEPDEVRAAMRAETWYTAEEAADAGMCDEVVETEQRVAAMVDPAIAARFDRVPDGVAVAKVGAAPQPAPAAAATPEAPQAEEPPAPAGIAAEAGTHNADRIAGNERERAIALGNRVYRRKEN